MASKTTPKTRLISVENAADQIDVNPKTIRRWIAAGLIPGYRVGPHLVRLDQNDLDNFVRRIPTGGAA